MPPKPFKFPTGVVNPCHIRVPYKDLGLNVCALPRLPIPSLENTGERYAAGVKALKKKSTVDQHLSKWNAFMQSGEAVMICAETMLAHGLTRSAVRPPMTPESSFFQYLLKILSCGRNPYSKRRFRSGIVVPKNLWYEARACSYNVSGHTSVMSQ